MADELPPERDADAPKPAPECDDSLSSDLEPLRLGQLTHSDGRRREVQVYRQLKRAMAEDLGGRANLTAVQFSVIHTLAGCAALHEVELRRCFGDSTRDPRALIGLSNAILGAAKVLGFRRIARDVIPTLAEISREASGES